ncbi:MAG: hypothetical protein ACYDIA_16430 [Candidatus Humimicrobiaceae bacterium]
MKCEYCGNETQENFLICPKCNKAINVQNDKIFQNSSEIKKTSAIVQNSRVIFNVFFYAVTISLAIYLLAGSSIPAVLLGHLTSILLNPLNWVFYVLIFMFKKNPKVVYGILSIIFGSINIFYVFGTLLIMPS